MRYLVVLKSGIKITINELTKDELENIRNNHGSNVTVGFGTNGSFMMKGCRGRENPGALALG